MENRHIGTSLHKVFSTWMSFRITLQYFDTISTLFDIEKTFGTPTNHMNECKADPRGRFYDGTIKADICNPDSPANSSFYRYTRPQGLVRLLDNLRVANGLAWNRKTNKFYFVDSCDFFIREYTWNPRSGDLCK